MKIDLLARIFLLGSTALGLASCATYSPTPYSDLESGGYGKKIIKVSDSYDGSLFMGNTYTSSKRAYHFSRMGAVEHCYERNKLALLVSTIDATKKTSYTGVSTSNYTVPGYSKFNGKTYRDSSKDQTHTNTYSYPVTLKYPNYATLFKCVTTFKSFKGDVKLEQLSKELVSPFTKDFKGGLLVKEANAAESKLLEGDVIVSVNGQRIEKIDDLYDNVYLKDSPISFVKVKVIRKQKFKTVNAELKDITDLILAQDIVETALACKHREDVEVEIPFCKETPSDWLKKFPKKEKATAI